ncbi:uncharacterized protein LOC132797053 [Drosophila nasuta]|uniref:uncharacterized protein LOC132797053 n=1 Tax=Drosophila nasuta TaxID=42062 RepID=UPI00295EC533|nr:uncharacterized protein LOC132797053 [Drosophila nasuta]
MEQSDATEATSAASVAPPRRLRSRAPPMPPDEVIRKSIARSLTQIVVNMRNADGQRKCLELLQAESNDNVEGKLLEHLEHIDDAGQRKQTKKKQNTQKT